MRVFRPFVYVVLVGGGPLSNDALIKNELDTNFKKEKTSKQLEKSKLTLSLIFLLYFFFYYAGFLFVKRLLFALFEYTPVKPEVHSPLFHLH